ncbi:hypothetical protein Hanom_Chr03g00192321 [Helianthus anomalus]
MGARKDQSVSYSHLTQEVGLDKSIDQCLVGSIALYCRHFEFSNLRLTRVLHFKIVYRAAGYDPFLLSFRRFFRLAKNGDWFTFETTQVDVCLISSMVTTLGSWKDRFFWVSESIVLFKMVWRHPDAVLNDLEPSESKLDSWFLKSIRACPSRLRPFPEHLLVSMGVSKLWDKPDRDHVLMRDGQVMSALDFIKSDDTSDVVFMDAETTKGDDVVVRGAEHRFEGSTYMNVPNFKGFTKVAVSIASTRRSTRHMLKGAEQPSGSKPVDLIDDIETPDDLEVGSKAACKKVAGLKGSGKVVEGSANVNPGEVYVPGWKVMVSDSFKSSSVCEDVLTHFAHPVVRDSCSSMDDDQMISKMILGACNLAALLPEGISRFRKRMQEYKVFLKKRDGMKASMVALKKENKGFAEKEKSWVMKVGEITKRHEVEVNELKKQIETLSAREKASPEEKGGLKSSLAQVTKDNNWLIEHGFQQVVNYLFTLLNSTKL